MAGYATGIRDRVQEFKFTNATLPGYCSITLSHFKLISGSILKLEFGNQYTDGQMDAATSNNMKLPSSSGVLLPCQILN